MKLKQVTIENYRAIERLELPLHPQLTVLHGDNGHGKTSVLSAIAVGLGSILRELPNISTIDFLKTDPHGSRPIRVVLEATEGFKWERRRGTAPRSWQNVGLGPLREAVAEIVRADQSGEPTIDLPIVAFYDTDRAVFDTPQRRRGFINEFSRYTALVDALARRTNFREFFKWFYAKEYDELIQQREHGDRNYRTKDLEVVRKAIVSMMPGVSQPRILTRPLRFVVSIDHGDSESDILAIDQLSGGYRIMLALVADLARRMAQGNPHLDNPLESEAVVLIDEVDLHLHPSWQQRVLPDLMRTFPNAQFIVSTHSPQVLTTVKPEHVVELYRGRDGIVAGPVTSHIYGAEAGDVLDAVMRVDERPPNNAFVSTLAKYMRLVDDGSGESEESKQLRAELENLSPHDPALDRADMEIWRHQFLRNMEES